MTGARRLSIKTSIHFTLLVTLATVVCSAAVLYKYSSCRRSEELGDAGAAAMARLLGSQLRTAAADSPEFLQRSCERLIQQPGVLAAGLWDQSGRMVAGAFVAPGLQRYLRPPRHGAAPSATDLVAIPPGLSPGHSIARQAVAEFSLPLVPGGPVRLALLLEAEHSLGAKTAMAMFLAPLLIVGLFTLFLASWWLRREVVRPILSVLQAATTDDARVASGDVFAREDELGAIARSLVGLQEDVNEWRDRAALIERRMGSQIAAETRRVTRELRRLERQSWLDPLTGVHNRRFLEEKFAAIFDAQRNARHDLSLIMLDIDRFKAVNDALGHAVGDELLRFAGQLLCQCRRKNDFAVRYGGDEFLLILPGASAENARALANRLVALFGQRAKMIANLRPPPTISAGVASIRQDKPATPQDLIGLADRALYGAKDRGGKTVCLSEPSRTRIAATGVRSD